MSRVLGYLAVVPAALLMAGAAQALTLNGFRRAHHLPPLHVSRELTAAAHRHAVSMARRDHLDHDGFDARMTPLATIAAENVAYGCRTEACVMAMWAQSPGHRRNMLMHSLTRYGLATARSAAGRTYWVLEMGDTPRRVRVARSRRHSGHAPAGGHYLRATNGRPVRAAP